jgi:hypothetical protein
MRRLLREVSVEVAIDEFAVDFSVTFRKKSNKILRSVIAQSAPRLNVIVLKSLNAPAQLATPTI